MSPERAAKNYEKLRAKESSRERHLNDGKPIKSFLEPKARLWERSAVIVVLVAIVVIVALTKAGGLW